jgi:DNA-binding MarR family transcriptional regulator
VATSSLNPATTPVALDLEDVARLRTAVMRLARRLRQQSSSGATPSQLAVLAALARRGPTSPGELAAEERVQPPSMTGIIDRLEEKGWVVRALAPGDGRSLRVSLTPAGRRLVSGVRSQRNAWLAVQLRGLDQAEVADLRRGINALEKILRDA